MNSAMKEFDSLITEMDGAASSGQSHGGSVSWRKVREFAFRLTTLAINYSILTKGEHEYLKEHHQITSTGIGLAKMALLRNNPLAAMEYLQTISSEIDEAVLKHLPEHYAHLQELTPHTTESAHV